VVGPYAGSWLTSGGVTGNEGKFNTFLGYKAGGRIYKGSNNVMIGVEDWKLFRIFNYNRNK
jgi:hypothetical protein